MPTNSSNRVLLALGLFLGLVVSVVVFSTLADDSEQEDGPGEPIVVDDRVERVDVTSPQSTATDLDTSNPLDVELRIHSRAAIVDARHSLGRESLIVESVVARSDAPASVEFVSGRASGRSERVSGRTVLGGLPRGWHLLRLTREGQATMRLVRVPSAQPLRVAWDRSAVVRGQVFGPDGKPVAGAEVFVVKSKVVTDASGGFEVASVVAGDHVPIRIAAEGRGAYFERIRVAAGAPPLRFVLEEAYWIRGTLQLPAAERRHARVAVVPASNAAHGTHTFPFYWPRRYADVPVDTSGRFKIEGIPRRLSIALAVVHPTYVLPEPVIVDPPTSLRRSGRQAFLSPRPTRVLSGRVRTAEDGPVPTATVTAQRPGSRTAWGATMFGSRIRAVLPGWLAHAGGARARAVAGGHFAIGLPWKRTEVRITADGFLGQAKTFRQVQRQIWNVVLDSQPEQVSDGTSEHRLIVRFEGGEAQRALRVTVRWGGAVREAPFLHDPRQPLELPPLRDAMLVDLELRRAGSAEGRSKRGVRVRGRTRVTLAMP